MASGNVVVMGGCMEPLNGRLVIDKKYGFSMGKKNTKYWIMGAIAFVIGIGLFFPSFLGKSRLNAEISELRKEGIPVTPQEFVNKYYKPIPQKQNGADDFNNACALLNEPEDDYCLVIRGLVKTPRLDQKLAPELLAEVKKDIQNNFEFFEEMEKVQKYNAIHFNYDWKSILNMMPDKNNKFRKAMRAYSLKIELAINNNSPKRAVEFLKSLLHFSYLAGQEPTTLVYACESIILNNFERCMNNLSFSDLDLKDFNKDFDKHEQIILEQWPINIQARLALLLTYIDFTKSNSFLSNVDEEQLLLAFFNYHNDLADEINLIRRLIKIPLDGYTKRKQELEKIEEESDKFTSIITISKMNGCQNIRWEALGIITRLRCAKTACAVQRFRLKHGRLPDKLDQLVPEFLAKVPIDLFSGKKLHYFKGSFDVKYEIPLIPKVKRKKSERDTTMFDDLDYVVTYKSVITKKKGFYIYSAGKTFMEDKGDLTTFYNHNLTTYYDYNRKDISFTVVDKK